MKRWLVALLLVTSAALACPACKKGEEGSAEDAKKVLVPFTKAGADHAALTNALRPKPEDYAAVFVGDAAEKVKSALEPVWDAGKATLKPAADQTEVTVVGATPDQLAKGEGNATSCPGGYKDMADKLTPSVTLYCARFTKPGDKLGLALDGLVYVNGHWALFPKSFRVVK